jgi:DNA-binding transcriptional ArsR family regulator
MNYALTFNYMVEYSTDLSLVFQSLADPTRRDILAHVSRDSLSVGQIAKYYDLTFAAVSKHLKVLEKARLVSKQRRGKEQIVTAAPGTVKEASDYLKRYEAMWNERFDALDEYLKSN